MPSVTVSGAHGATVALQFDSKANAALARSLADAITAGVRNGNIIPADDSDGPPPSVPVGKAGEFVQYQDNGVTVLPTGYTAFVNVADKAIAFGSGEAGQSILSSEGDLTFIAAAGSGTVVAGAGDNRILLGSTITGDWSVNTDRGDDTVRALGAGNDTINAGRGDNAIMLGAGSDLVNSTGDDVIVGGTGQATITAIGDHGVLMYGNASNIYFVGAEGSATLYGGTGSDTFFGSEGKNLVYGGSAGNNLLFAGTGRATLFGGGDGDQLFAEGDKRQVLHAGAGNVTLSGVFGSGENSFYAGSGATQIIGGQGNDTITAGTGSATATGGAGEDLFQFVDGQAGGSARIEYFIKGEDKIALEDYGRREVAKALKSQEQVDGSATLTLSDGTTITFVDVAKLTASDFVIGDEQGGGKGHGHGRGGDEGRGHGRGGDEDRGHAGPRPWTP